MDAQVTNKTSSDLDIPGRSVKLRPGVPSRIKNWEKLDSNELVNSWKLVGAIDVVLLDPPAAKGDDE